ASSYTARSSMFSLSFFFSCYATHPDLHLFPYTTLFRSLRGLRDPQRERDVVANAQVRVEGIALEHHRDVALLRRQVVDDLFPDRSEEHTSELQSRSDLVCRLLLEKKKKIRNYSTTFD